MIAVKPPVLAPMHRTALARRLRREQRGAAIVEMALVLPMLLVLLMGMLVYGHYFLLAHSVQQAANDGARAAIVGLDGEDRRTIAEAAVARSLQGVEGTHSVTVSETGDAVTVAVGFAAADGAFVQSGLVPSPARVIRTRATFELPVD
ncbi:MAG: transporter [Alphaproteobacteria bacterium HGW-Alphaproteobacteria-17]|nr:MAG: transporter [Alphaproteobacteria bacterium HGW-Alphaproteobacteria-17]